MRVSHSGLSLWFLQRLETLPVQGPLGGQGQSCRTCLAGGPLPAFAGVTVTQTPWVSRLEAGLLL